ncbi:MAG: hypothetical protein A2351_05840 [Omnitrophica bacterium RIFOXYB12_FULL_50_7]|nr:MAG: hypothetical protein A2351_05840 [Omnitrophica bacterium RIFOXYB12_FULL_50_7]
MKFVCNIQRFILRFFCPAKNSFSFSSRSFFSKKFFLLVDKIFFCCRMTSLSCCVRPSFWERTFILVCFLLWKTCLQALY